MQEFKVPSSKSISNRLLIIKYLSKSDKSIKNLSLADDTILMQNILYQIDSNPSKLIFTDNAGTVTRFIISLLALKHGVWQIDADPKMRERPIIPLIEALKSLGAEIKYLENEWAKYKYYVLSNSGKTYNEIRTLLKEKSKPSVKDFYNLIEFALDEETTKYGQINAIQHMWGYFKKAATEAEKDKFLNLLEGYREDKKTLSFPKNYLFKLSQKYSVKYLLDSLYFYIS